MFCLKSPYKFGLSHLLFIVFGTRDDILLCKSKMSAFVNFEILKPEFYSARTVEIRGITKTRFDVFDFDSSK